jgi:prepilin-type N-terminal cleavage/methylation domain-containing protein
MKSGFTIVELLVVIAILGLLIAMLIPVLQAVIPKGSEPPAPIEQVEVVDGQFADAVEFVAPNGPAMFYIKINGEEFVINYQDRDNVTIFKVKAEKEQ